MSQPLYLPNLKEVIAYKKKLNWGDIPTIYRMTSSSINELDNILTHGFESAYKTLLDRTTWNLKHLEGYKDSKGNIQVKHKPKISISHVYNEQSYELNCYPVIDDKNIYTTLLNHEFCPFVIWRPENMRMLFRINNLVSFIVYTLKNGDKADMELIKYAYRKVENLIDILKESFEIVTITGFNIAEFSKQLFRRRPHFNIDGLIERPLTDKEETD